MGPWSTNEARGFQAIVETSSRRVAPLECFQVPDPWTSTPNLFFPSGTPQIQRVMTMMIRDHEVLFPKSKDAPLSPPVQKNDAKKAPVPRSSVGWDATEDPPLSRTDSCNSTVRCLLPQQTLPSVWSFWGSDGWCWAVGRAGTDRPIRIYWENLGLVTCVRIAYRLGFGTLSPRQNPREVQQKKMNAELHVVRAAKHSKGIFRGDECPDDSEPDSFLRAGDVFVQSAPFPDKLLGSVQPSLGEKAQSSRSQCCQTLEPPKYRLLEGENWPRSWVYRDRLFLKDI